MSNSHLDRFSIVIGGLIVLFILVGSIVGFAAIVGWPTTISCLGFLVSIWFVTKPKVQ